MSITARGGYQIVDLHDAVFTVGTPITIPGIYAQISNFINKPVIVSGGSIVSPENEIIPIPCMVPSSRYPVMYGENGALIVRFDFDGDTLELVIGTDDSVQITGD